MKVSNVALFLHRSSGKCKSWTLDSGLDRGLDYGLIFGLDYGLSPALVTTILILTGLPHYFGCSNVSLGPRPHPYTGKRVWCTSSDFLGLMTWQF